VLETDGDARAHVYDQSLVDLAALRFYPHIAEQDVSLPAAGLPWFMTLFGRDSIITSYQALPYQPELARTTLRTLAARQGTTVDDFRDREPGKILHEIRFGELTATGEWPHSPYYGTADATPLYLVLLDEYERWSGDADLVRELEPNARAALEWIDRYGDLDGDGYVEYQTRNPRTGLVNQCWKDSWNSILFSDGTIAQGPIATCEIQGYVYDAKRRAARLAREVWRDDKLAERLTAEADDLRRRFHEDYWIPDRAFFALALDGEKRPVDSLTSNIGHLLWSGIVREEQAQALARHLMGEGALLGLGRADHGRRRRGLQPDRVPQRHGLAPRQLAHRSRVAPLWVPGGGRADRVRNRPRVGLLRVPPAGGLRGLPGGDDPRAGGVPDGVAPAGMGGSRPAARADHRARPRSGRRRSPGRPAPAR
jgi:glycogen debranching enzyme